MLDVIFLGFDLIGLFKKKPCNKNTMTVYINGPPLIDWFIANFCTV